MRRAFLLTALLCAAPLLLAQTESLLREQRRAHPEDFQANHNFGEFYIQQHRLPQAIPFLEKAYQLDPSQYANGYDLALAYLQSAKPAKCRAIINALLKRADNAELHNLLADVEEAEGHVDAAAHQYEVAARMDPSEKHLFDLGSDLTLHGGFDPALKVFQFAAGRYPQSARLRVGLGVVYYSLGQYDEALEALCRAVDLDPADTKALDFLGKMHAISPQYADAVTQRLAHFAEVYPGNAAASYYYALSLRKRTLGASAKDDSLRAEKYLLRSVRLAPAFAEAHFELALLYEEQGQWADALSHFEHAVRLRPGLAKAHYHLARLYRKDGRMVLAQKELRAFEALKAKP